jgi:hypothetical protein
LSNDRNLLLPFLRWLGIGKIPPIRDLRIVEQQVPDGAMPQGEAESQGLPDACIYTRGGWAVLFESKIQAKGAADQLRRHLRTAIRYGYSSPHLVLVSVDRPQTELPDGTRFTEWRTLYQWFVSQARHSQWAWLFVEYMQDFEARMISREYEIRGTLTMFTGLHFDEERPYTYSEGKRLLRLLCNELQSRKDLARLGLDPNGKRRTAITGSDADWIWDLLPLKAARRASQATDFPHCDVRLARDGASAEMTVPNGVKGGFRARLREVGLDGFKALLGRVESNLQPLIRRSPTAVPGVYVLQRHFRSQRSQAQEDAGLRADLRTLVHRRHSPVKCQPEWADAIYELLCNKRSNLQFGVKLCFDYACPVVRSRRVIDLFAGAWKAMWPVAEFVLGEAR